MDKAQWWMEMNVSEDTGLAVEGRECRMRNPRGKKCRNHANLFSGFGSLFQNSEEALEDF